MTFKQATVFLTPHHNKDKAKKLYTFFKTQKGGYGEGDEFLGIKMPVIREAVKKFKELPFPELQRLLKSKFHEHRMLGLLILVNKYKRANEPELKHKIYLFFLDNLESANSWDLIDVTVPHVIGNYMLNHEEEKQRLYSWALSNNLWERRIAMLSCFAFIRAGQYDDALNIADMLLHDTHDLVHKAVGWMLREIGKRDYELEKQFLLKRYKTMPRTMLRYAIERFTPTDRAYFMQKG